MSYHLGLEFEREGVSLPLVSLDAFECIMLLVCFHLFASVKYSTKSLQDHYSTISPAAYAGFLAKNRALLQGE